MNKRQKNTVIPTQLRSNRPQRKNPQPPDNITLEKVKNLATIISAIAIPIVLTIAGYYIQKQLSSEGIRKDYVGFATAVLKENAANQEPELRAWAVKILDTHSPIPFSPKAKEGLRTGLVVTPGLAWIGPPDDCRIPPKEREIYSRISKISKESHSIDDEQYIKRLIEFLQYTGQAEKEANFTAIRLKCLQDWVNLTEKSDIEYRNAIGAPSSKSILEEMKKEQIEKAKLSKNSTAQQIK